MYFNAFAVTVTVTVTLEVNVQYVVVDDRGVINNDRY